MTTASSAAAPDSPRAHAIATPYFLPARRFGTAIEAWLDALLPYLAGNRDLLDKRIEAAAPGARSMRLDATYLGWVNFSGTGLSADDVAKRVSDKAKIFASPGPQFGPGGDTWLRFNFATPRPILTQALDRLDEAFADLRK